jgi:phosphorylase kinase alpha/beta subunit
MIVDDQVQNHINNLRALIASNGLLLAAPEAAQTNYHKVWLRDNVYESLAFEYINDWETVKKTYSSLLDIFHKHSVKIKWASLNKPTEYKQYISSRYDPDTLDEVWEGGNKQSDAIGAVLFKLADFETRNMSMLRNDQDRKIVQDLLNYVCSIEYWHDPDSGMWEEDEALRASSVGAVLAALKKWQEVGNMEVDKNAIQLGEAALKRLLPRETELRFVDLALLSLIYPYNIVDNNTSQQILDNVIYHLERDKGLIRYKFDHYYNNNADGYSEEAEWCFGLSWLAIIFHLRGNNSKAIYYLNKATETVTTDGKVPELYMSHTNDPNSNIPLGWAESLYIVALRIISRPCT